MTQNGTVDDVALRVSRGKRAWILALAGAYVLATLWQVFWKRDDWPLSAFAMYSQTKVKTAGRRVLVGVTADGEFELADKNLGNLSLRHLDRFVPNSKESRYLTQIQRFTPALSEKRDLQGIRVYSESWPIARNLKGIDHPKRKLARSLYIAPQALLQQLREQRDGAPALPALALAPGDKLFELNANECDECDVVADAQAGSGDAVWLLGASADAPGGQLELDVTLPAGRWHLFVRLRAASMAESVIPLLIESSSNAEFYKLGRTWASLPYDAWVWASAPSGEPPVQIEVAAETTYRLVFEANKSALYLDQVWFSRKQRELPATSNPREQ